MMSENVLGLGILSVMGGIFVVCVLAAVLLGVILVRMMSEDKPANIKQGANDESKVDNHLFKQWDSLLGYNGIEGDEIDE